jgi:hypothetical protein
LYELLAALLQELYHWELVPPHALMQLDMTAFRMPPQVVLTWLLHIELQYVAVVGCASKRTSMAHTAMAADRL